MIAHFRRPILGGGAFSPDGSQGCVDRTSLTLEWTQGDHRRVKTLFQNSDIFLRFETRATQSEVLLKLEFEVRIKWGAVGNFGFD